MQRKSKAELDQARGAEILAKQRAIVRKKAPDQRKLLMKDMTPQQIANLLSDRQLSPEELQLMGARETPESADTGKKKSSAKETEKPKSAARPRKKA